MANKIKLFLALAVCFIAPACMNQPAAPESEIHKATKAEAPRPSPVGLTGSAMKPPTKKEKPVNIAYRQFLRSSDTTNAGVKSFVVFTHRPTNEIDAATYKHVCQQWLADFETKESAVAASAKINAKLIPFYWPTTSKTPTDCDSLFEYDYAFAAVVAASIGPTAYSVGPLLVLQQDNEWLLLDISKFEPVDVQRAFVIWKRQIVSENPLSAKFTFVKFREYFRTLVNMYGESIAKHVKIS